MKIKQLTVDDKMKTNMTSHTWIGVWIALLAGSVLAADSPAYRSLPVKEYRDKMKAGWIGQMAGVSLGAPTEFKCHDRISHTAYDVPGLVDGCEKLARKAIAKEGGRIEEDAQGEEIFVIPVKPVTPGKAELRWAPGPVAVSKFNEAEMDQINIPESAVALKKAVHKLAPGWISPSTRARASSWNSLTSPPTGTSRMATGRRLRLKVSDTK